MARLFGWFWLCVACAASALQLPARGPRARLLVHAAADPDASLQRLGNETLQSAKSLVEGAVRAATGDETYTFGDLTRRKIDATRETLAGLAGKASVDDYEFGDVTRRFASDADRSLRNLTDAAGRAADARVRTVAERYARELPPQAVELFRALVVAVPPRDRAQLAGAAASWLAVAALSWSLVVGGVGGLFGAAVGRAAATDRVLRRCRRR